MADVDIIVIPGKYRTIITQLSRLILSELKVFKTNKKNKSSIILFKEIVNTNIPLHFYLGVETKFSDTAYVTGNAYNPTSKWNEQIPYIEISIETNEDPKHRSDIVYRLANTLRHEIEHLTQSGYNTIPGNYLPDDQYEREIVNDKEYFLLPKEINAGVRGIYSQACKMKKPFNEMLYDYLFETYLLESDIEEIAHIYLDKALELNLIKKRI